VGFFPCDVERGDLSRFGITCTRASLAALFACTWAAAAWAGGPGDIYNDFAADGKLSCNHSRADLEAVLRSGSLNQYGDPFTLARLKLAVRKQLAGSCRAPARTNAGTSTGSDSGTGSSRGYTTPSTKKAAKHRRQPSAPGTPRRVTERTVRQGAGDNASFFAGRALIIGLLIAAIAFGGWLTRRALARD
jgi:hypothetical protein